MKVIKYFLPNWNRYW